MRGRRGSFTSHNLSDNTVAELEKVSDKNVLMYFRDRFDNLTIAERRDLRKKGLIQIGYNRWKTGGKLVFTEKAKNILEEFR